MIKLKKNLILTGMMGVGKSTIGNSLSERLNMKFIDVDKVIEKQEGVSIKNIFENKGEKYFRDVEKTISLELLKKNNSVIALGGGAFMDENIRNSVLKFSVSFWLDIDLKSLQQRLSNFEKRPLLSNDNLEKTLKDIYLARKNIYSLADFRIDCNKSKKPLIVEKIAKIYEHQ